MLIRSADLCAAMGVLLVSGCSSPPLSGGHDAATVDLAVVDLGIAPPADLSSAPTAKRLIPGDYKLECVTGDGHVLVKDGVGLVSAIDLNGGAPVNIATDTGAFTFCTQLVAFVWHNGDGFGNGPLTLWSAATGVVQLSTTSAFDILATAASSDGRYVAYTDHISADTTAADLVLDKADHSAPRVLESQMAISQCVPQVGFVGGRLIAEHCPTNSSSASISSYDQVTGAAVTLLASAASFWTRDSAGKNVLASDGNHQAFFIPIAGGAPTLVASNYVDGFLTHDDSALLYVSTTQQLVLAPLGGQPVILQASGARHIDGLSQDDRWVMYSLNRDANLFDWDAYLASAKSPGASTMLWPATTVDGYAGAFTDDSATVVLKTDTDANTFVGNLRAAPVTGGALQMVASAAYLWQGIGGSKILIGDHVDSTAGTLDIEIVDFSTGVAPTPLVQKVGLFYSLTPDNRSVLYTVANDGLWIAPLP
jgi:hypothetical protein